MMGVDGTQNMTSVLAVNKYRLHIVASRWTFKHRFVMHRTMNIKIQLNAALTSTVIAPSVGLTCTTCCQCAIHTLSQKESSSCRAG